MGNPGSGKTTIAKRLERYGFVRYSQDEHNGKLNKTGIKKEMTNILHLLTFQMPIFNKPHKHLFLGFYYSALYLTVKNVKSTVRNFTLRLSNLTQ
jgi:hypothetical protein